MSDVAAALPEEDDWRRLSPLTLLIAVVGLGPKLIRMVPALAAIGIAGSWVYVAPAMLVFLLASLGFSWLAWMRFRWRIGDDAVVIESGIFDRQHRTIPFDRIQDVSIEQGLVARALGLAKVAFETGAAEGEKGKGDLDALALEEAEDLRRSIRAWRGGAAVVADGAAVEIAHDDDAELYRLTPTRLVLAGLFNFSLAALAVVGVAAQWFDDLLPVDIFSIRFWMNLAEDSGVGSWIEAHRWVAAMGALAGLLLVGFATGVARTVLVNWNFLLTLGPRAFRRVRGLTTRTDVAIPLARVQAAVVATGLIRQRWGWHELRLQSLASDGDKEKDHQLVPFGQLEDIDRVLEPVRLVRPADGVQCNYPPLLAQAYPGFIGGALAIAAAIGVLTFGQPYWPIPLIVGGLLVCISVFTARRHRWADDGAVLYIWRGWWSPRLTILPFANVQSADIADGPVLRRFDCVRVDLGVPGESVLASHSIDAVPVGVAAELRARILSARSRRA
jgi:putative membrane protein